MDQLNITATDGAGTFDAFLVRAKESPAGVVVLIQEIFGVNESMQDTARQVADWGFHVLAPDLFWRLKPGVNLTDKTDAEWKEALDLMNRFDQAKGVVAVHFGRRLEWRWCCANRAHRQPNRFNDVGGALDEGRAVADQLVAALCARVERRARNRHHLAPGLGGKPPVISDPDLGAASITTVPPARPAIIRLRYGKCRARGSVPGGISAMTSPRS